MIKRTFVSYLSIVIRKVLLKIYMVWVLLVFTVFMIILFPLIVLPFLLGEKYGGIGYTGLYIWSWLFSKLTFIRYKIIGQEKIDKNTSYAYASNHTSFLDIPGIRIAIPTQFRPLAKKELLKIPVFNIITRYATVVVDRSSPESRKASVARLQSILNQGISILIFPEGTQNRTKELLQPFHDGAFRIAMEGGAPIMPIVVTNAGKLMPPSKLHIEPGVIKVIFGEPVSTAEYSQENLSELKQKVFDQMEQLLKEHI